MHSLLFDTFSVVHYSYIELDIYKKKHSIVYKNKLFSYILKLMEDVSVSGLRYMKKILKILCYLHIYFDHNIFRIKTVKLEF